MNTTRIACVLSAIIAVTLSGCQYATQTVMLQPVATVSQTGLEEGRTISLTVVDDRPEIGLGHRQGGYGQGAEIRLGNDLEEAVRNALVDGLRKLNVTVVDSQESAPIQLKVTIRSLKYVGSSGMMTFGSRVEGALRAEGSAGESRFEKRYVLDSPDKRSVIVTTAEFNERILNEGLSDLIGQLLNDPDFIAFLRQ